MIAVEGDKQAGGFAVLKGYDFLSKNIFVCVKDNKTLHDTYSILTAYLLKSLGWSGYGHSIL